MNTKNANIKSVECKRKKLIVAFDDGREIATPLEWYPRLVKGTAKQRANWEICGAGRGIHWPELDEDLSIEGMINGIPSVEYRHAKSLRRRSATRQLKSSKTGHSELQV